MIDISEGLHGAHTYQVARAAMGEYRLRAAVEAGELVGLGRGVLLDARRVLDLRTRCAAAQLLTGGIGVVIGPTAAALHGCTTIAGFPVHVRVPYSYRFRSRRGVIVHQGPVGPSDVTMVDGLRVQPLELAVSEVLCSGSRRAALGCVDQALRGLRADDRPGLRELVAARLAERVDRRGTRQAAALLSLATGLPETPTQSAFVLLLAECGFPKPVCQYQVWDGTKPRHRLDFAWPELRVALECDEEQAPAPLDEDAWRLRGWQVIRAEPEDLADPTPLCGRLRTALRERHDNAA
ncbi:MAG TPA: hypothetical protein VFX16_12580 [Pseudonocardiaceae bacterium]|nr:hypothetical protein [Pseudonocardiaceae bacterium]